MNTKAFNNLMVWRIADYGNWTLDVLNAMLAEKAARPPSAMEPERSGFITPLGVQDTYAEPVDATTLLVGINVAKRMLPGKVVRREVEARARKIAEDEGRKVFAREKQRIKEHVYEELLPQAFVDHSQVYALINPPYIFIGTSSAKRGELLLDNLRAALGSLKVVPVSTATPAIRAYTRWFSKGQTESPRFTLGQQFTVHGTSSDSEAVKGSWPFANDETLSDWVTIGGQRVTSLGLIWESSDLGDDVSFVTNEMLGIRAIKWPQVIVDRANEQAGDHEDSDEQALAAARATLMILSHEIRTLWADLLHALGGEALPRSHEAVSDDDDDDGLI